MKRRKILFIFFTLLLGLEFVTPKIIDAQKVGDQDNERDAYRVLTKEAPSNIAQIRRKISRKKAIPKYNLVNSENINKAGSETVDVGYTIWMLKESSLEDNTEIVENIERITKIKKDKKVIEKKETIKVTPRRINSDTQFSNGDGFRFSLDVPISGFVYIFNREGYKDGTLSTPYLIFPRVQDKDKADKTIAGKLIFIPNVGEHFEIEETTEINKVKAKEIYYILITPNRLPETEMPLLESDEPRKISPKIFAKYEKFKAPFWKFESTDEAGKAITKIEKLASTDNNGALEEDDPLPQTICRIAKKLGEPIIFTISAEIKR